MPTVRERLEQRTSELKTAHAAYERAGKNEASKEAAELIRLGTEVSALVDELSKVDPDVAPHATQSQVALRALAAHGGNSPAYNARHPSSSATETAPTVKGNELKAFNFSPDQLADLHRNAVNRRPAFKAAIASTDADMAGRPGYVQSVFPWLRDKTRILDLIPTEPTDRPSVHYYQATAAADGATTVAEGAAKPESSPTWAEQTATIRKFAHYAKFNDEVLADFDGFLEVLGKEMIAGLIDEENAQVVAGDGTGTNLLGLTAEPNVLTVGSAGTDLDAVAAAFAALKLGAAKVDPDVVVMHPNDWYSTGFLLAKDGNNRYLVGDPLNGTTPRLWGVPVVLTEAMVENTALVANLKVACTAYMRQRPTFEVHPWGGGADEFIANQTLVRAEERLGLAIHHPKAVCLVGAV